MFNVKIYSRREFLSLISTEERGENTMIHEEKESVRKEINLRIAKTNKTIERLHDQIKPIEVNDGSIGRVTRMDAIQQKSMLEANLRSAEELLSKLERALDNLDKPHFGICVKCQRQIPLERILVIPETRFCVNCADMS